MTEREIVEWLLEGDVAIEYQARRDLLGEQCPDLQRRIGEEGWRVRVLSFRKSDGTWGRGFSQPKWTSSHYTLLGLRTLELPANNPMARAKNETSREATGAGEPSRWNTLIALRVLRH